MSTRQTVLIREKVEKAKAVLKKVKSRQELATALEEVASQHHHCHQDNNNDDDSMLDDQWKKHCIMFC